ncbi:MAG: ATP-binding protein [Steroidobacteraceae bacterium]
MTETGTSATPTLADRARPSGDVTLDNCAREPIHLPGLIQPHGALVAFEPATGTVLHASRNLGDLLPVGSLPIKGRLLADLVGEEHGAAIIQSLAAPATGLVRHEVIDLPARKEPAEHGELQAVVHSHRGIGIAEFERAPAVEESDALQGFSDTLDALRTTDELDELVDRIAHRVKRLTGFDRVMVYQFKEDWHGHVVADAHEPGMESFHDLHYPASDIPAQARELYRSNLVRYIPDVDYEAVPVMPWFDDDRLQMLDMSHSLLRSVSPIHVQYLQNMGVRATLTISLLVEGELWGLIACHHRTPKTLPLRLRRACYALSVTAGYMVSSHLKQSRSTALAAASHASERVLGAFNQVQTPLPDVIEQCGSALLRAVDATGGAFWSGDTVHAFGQWPGPGRAASVLRHVRHAFETTQDDIICTDRLALQPALADDERRVVCGLMALKLDEHGLRGIVWLRPAYRREVSWGGDPDKAVQVEIDAQGRPKLSPRSSFARWVELVTDRSRSWSDVSMTAARGLLALRQTLQVRDTLAQLSLNDRRFRGLVTLQSDAYWRLDSEGRVVTLSRPLAILGDHVEGRPFASLFAQLCDEDDVAALGHALRLLQPFRGLRVATRPARGQAARLYSLSGEPTRDLEGSLSGWHGTISDLTTDVVVEESAWVRQEVEALTTTARSQFLAQVSRELRAPVSDVSDHAQMLLSESALGKRERGWVQAIRRAADRMRESVSSLAGLADLEAQGLRLRLVDLDLADVAHQVVEEAHERAVAQGITLTVDAPPGLCRASLDPVRLKRALRNLLSNALRYNHRGGTAHVALVSDEALREVGVEVRDSGPGLDALQRATLFVPFDQTGRVATQVPGKGLGLVVARLLVERMGGRITVDSTPGHGSTFGIRLPRADRNPPV